MLGSAVWLTLATLLGLCLGFAREWLLVAAWGAGERSDAFLIAVFLPEALRMSLAGGVLSAAALPLYLVRERDERLGWLAVLFAALLLIALVISLLLTLLAPWLVQLLGPGLADGALALASRNLQVVAWCVPGLMLHALFSVPLQASERFVLAGLGSLLFNLPPVTYLALAGTASQPHSLALACLAGSLLMPLALLPSMWRLGWRPWRWQWSWTPLRELGQRIGPLLLSNGASQGLALVERLVASLLGEGAVTWVNLARKLMNLPLIALMSLNQVLLGMMSRRQGNERLALLKRGLETASMLTLPAGVGLIAAAPSLVALLLPKQSADSPLPLLLAWFAVPLVFGAWNALLARYAYAAGDTRQPLRCELLGSLVNVLLLGALPFVFGLAGIPMAALAGVICTALLLMQRQALLGALPWARHWLLGAVLMGASALALFQVEAVWLQLGLSTLAGATVLLGMGLWLKPWRKT
ncbi:murein biosynthesis integral membrane protein MurJ [Pseudomonas sp. SWRI18]|uniref:lipid II flippase MurJ n=1 Tax=Pseudomonas sp. SWRI18 TaxID=2753888 RepID=UPI0016481AFF|nr:murein biosynthesis integral membrane protein MurJ [Pseudomonas sp. SWRI18]MBC3304092.1 murein biosynthesis integral membrane protein MurJ [Pseudomonas sp. SWRI18]